MAYSVNLLDPKIEKHSLVVVRPKKRLAGGWSLHSGPGDGVSGLSVWVSNFTDAEINAVWAAKENSSQWTKDAAIPTTDKHWYQDTANGKIYLALQASKGPDDPDSTTGPTSWRNWYGPTTFGLTVEINLYFSETEFQGPSDPLDSTSSIVEWRAGLKESPQAQSGSRQSLYGFNPLNDSSLSIDNADGFLEPFLYDYSWYLCTIRSYVMADRNLENAALFANVKEIFRGYGSQLQESDNGLVSCQCTDFLGLLQNAANPASRFSSSAFAAVDPEAIKPGQEWWIRRVRGIVDNHVPVNIDYSATAATNNNRKWVTHEGTSGDGTIVHTINAAGANTTTKTFFTTTPKYNIGDEVDFSHSVGGHKYVTVETVNRASKFITHEPITRTITAGDTCTRQYIGWVAVKQAAGEWLKVPLSSLTMIHGTGPNYLGFQLANDFESAISFTANGGIFDPAQHAICCRVYGTAVLDTYSDGITPVGAIADDGGVVSNAVSLLYWLLRQAGIDSATIDQSSFAGVPTNHQLGIAIPRKRDDTTVESFSSLVDIVLQSLIWKMVYVDISGEVGIGLLEVRPFVAGPDYEADDNDFTGFAFEHDYTALASEASLQYAAKEISKDGDFDLALSLLSINVADGTQAVSAENLLCKDLHGVVASVQFQTNEILQFLVAEAQVIADRYAFIFGDRRAYYTLNLGPEFLAKSSLGASYQVDRAQLPGYSFTQGTSRSRQLLTIESTLSAQGVSLTLEDQKGVQDNSGSW